VGARTAVRSRGGTGGCGSAAAGLRAAGLRAAARRAPGGGLVEL